MLINDELEEKKMTIYQLAKLSGVPYATLNDICHEKTKLTKCSAETVYKISQALDISMEDLLAPYLVKRSSFENFKSAVCHRVKEEGDIDFMIGVIKKEYIPRYFKRKWYPECYYLLAMVDYLSRLNDFPLVSDYDDIRRHKLKKIIYPASILAIAAVEGNDNALRRSEKEAIPEFMRFNIVENDIRDVA